TLKSDLSSADMLKKETADRKLFSPEEIRNLLIIAAAGLLLRLVFVFESSSGPFYNNLVSDSKIYNDWALSLIGKGNFQPGGVFFMAPFYPYFLAAVYSITGEAYTVIRIIQVLASSATIFIVYLAARKLLGRKTAYTAAVITALYKLFIFYSAIMLSETLQTFFVSLFVLLLIEAIQHEGKVKWLTAGLFLGISGVFRANILLFLPLLILWLAYRGYKERTFKAVVQKAVVFLVIGTVLPVLPLTLHNYIYGHDFVLMTSNGGINFYLGNNPESQGVFKAPSEFDFYSDLSGEKYAEKLAGSDMKPSEASSYWQGRGMEYVRSDFGGALLNTIRKFFLFMGGNENPQSFIMNPDYYRDNNSGVLQLPLPDFALISILSIAGLILSIKRKQKFTYIYLFIVSYVIASILFFISGRFRLALTPVLIIFAAYFIIEIFESVRSGAVQDLKLPAVISVVFLLIYTFLVPKPAYSGYDAYIAMGEINFRNKEYDKAVENYSKALLTNDSYSTFMNIGNAYAAKKDFPSALSAFQKALNRNPDNPLVYFNIGLVHSQTGNLQMAEKAYLKTLELDPGFTDVYRNLGIVYYISERYNDALMYFDHYVKNTKDEAGRASVLKDIETIRLVMRNKASK
ncbi:MAG: tetratricopeptide repeat protein, partial [Syntrophothermus sp.]